MKTIKIFERLLGFYFLLMGFITSFSFWSSLVGSHGDFSMMRNLSGAWDYSDNSMSPAPIYLALMTIAGAMLFIDGIKDFKEEQTNDEAKKSEGKKE